MSNPRILVFTGDGKGKTTAAMGMALRAAGHGLQVLILQFLKNDQKTGELTSLGEIDGITIRQVGKGFVPPADSPTYPQHQQAAIDALNLAKQAVADRQHDLIVLDEICGAISLGLIPEAHVLELLAQVPSTMHLVLTGRGATDALINAADTVTEMRCIKHAYENGMHAQKGVEF